MAHHCGDALRCVAMVGILFGFSKFPSRAFTRFVRIPYFWFVVNPFVLSCRFLRHDLLLEGLSLISQRLNA